MSAPPSSSRPAPATRPARAKAGATAATDPRRVAALTHELQVHQIELESQNEELRRTQADLATARDRFVDLFEFAPVGYLMLGMDGRITEINLTGAALLGEARRLLLQRPFARFIIADDAERWRQHLKAVAAQPDEPRRIELTLQARKGTRHHAQLDCVHVAAADAPARLRVTLTDITQRHMAEMDRRVAANVVASRESERRRVARELHEELGQRLSALKMELSSLRGSDVDQGQRIAAMMDSVDEAMATVRRIAGELRPLMLDDLGLNAAMDWLARDAGRRLGLNVTLQLDEADPPLTEPAAIALYRLVQATLVHVAHQNGGTEVSVQLRQKPGVLLLTVQDTGSGWPAPAPAAAGPRAPADDCMHLREQAHLLGGRLELSHLPGGGLRLRYQLPLPAASAGAPSHSPTTTP